MDLLSNKAVMIGAGILASIIIMTGVLTAVNQIKEIYGYVDKTDISVVKEFDDILSTYNGAKMNGVDLVNTIRRFEGSDKVTVEYPPVRSDVEKANFIGTMREAEKINSLMKSGTDLVYKYETIYNVGVEYYDGNTKMKIKFRY